MRSAARWCDQHGRWECTRSRSRDRGPCHGPAVKDTDGCRFHLGKTVEAARRDAVTAWAAALGDHGISPRDAVSAQLALAWRRAQLLGEALRGQVEAAGAVDGGALAAVEAAERDRVVRYAKTAHEMGVADHWAATLAELGGAVVTALDRALAGLGWEQRDMVLAALTAELGAIETGDGAA